MRECVEAVEVCDEVGDEVVHHSGDGVHDFGFGMIMVKFWLWMSYLCASFEEHLLCDDRGVDKLVPKFAISPNNFLPIAIPFTFYFTVQLGKVRAHA